MDNPFNLAVEKEEVFEAENGAVLRDESVHRVIDADTGLVILEFVPGQAYSDQDIADAVDRFLERRQELFSRSG